MTEKRAESAYMQMQLHEMLFTDMILNEILLEYFRIMGSEALI